MVCVCVFDEWVSLQAHEVIFFEAMVASWQLRDVTVISMHLDFFFIGRLV